MGSAIATTRPDRRRRSILSSRIARLIFIWNLVGFAVLTAGALLLSELRAQLIRAKIDALTTQGELIANVLAETATVGDPQPALQERRARIVMQRLLLPRATRVRLFLPDGTLVADSNLIADRVVERKLKPVPDEKRPARILDPVRQFAADAGAWRITPWKPDFTLAEERAVAAAGTLTSGQRLGDSGVRVVSVSLPVQRVQAVLGVLTLEAADVDDILRAERRAMLPFIAGAGVILLLASGLLAVLIAQPLRKLAYAADQLRNTGATRLVLPDVVRRPDEIGDLAQSLERMTGALAERIDANERFAADVSHEVKNPLTSIRSAVETARRIDDPTARERLMGIIAADVGRLDRLITDIARASRLEAETARGASDRVDLGKLLADIAETYTMTRREGEAGVKFTGPSPATVFVVGQAGPLGQVFRNLIDNARSFSPPGGEVRVTLTRETRDGQSFVRAQVEDDGPGIPGANLETVFERFYTERPKGAAFGGNSGLGLSIARQIVEAHKGVIRAENIAKSGGGRQGARLIVELPSADTYR